MLQGSNVAGRACAMILVANLTLTAAALAQPADPPPSLTDAGVLPVHLVARHDQTPPSTATIALINTFTDKGRPPIGLNLKAGLEPGTHGTWEDLSSSGQIWRLRVRSLGAVWVRPGFGIWRIPAGAKMWVYDETYSEIHGPYDASNVHAHGQRWTPGIMGDTAVVELYWPEALRGTTPNVDLTRFSHGTNGPLGGGDECACDPDTSCPIADDASVVKRGWARMNITIDICQNNSLYQVEKQCSGTFINTTANDCTQFYLTAGHCVTQPGLIPSSWFLFNFERPMCCDGTASNADQIVGSTKTAEWDGVPGGGANEYSCDPEDESGGNDMALLFVDDPIPQSFNLRFNGWSRSAAETSPAACIHMPTPGVSRKLAISTDGHIVHPTDANFWRVPDWEFGATYGGSSGGALFNDVLRVIGWLCCGGVDECPAAANDNFGRLGVAWEGGGTINSQLKYWLDPANTNMVSYHGRDDAPDLPCRILPWPSVIGIAPQGGAPTPSPGATLTLPVQIKNMGSSMLTNLTGRLSTTTPGVTVLIDEAAWPDIDGFDTATPTSPMFVVHLDPSVPCGTDAAFKLDLYSDAGDRVWHPPFTLRVGETVQDAPQVLGPFTQASLSGSNQWQLDSTDDTPLGPRWMIPGIAAASDTVLISNAIASLPANARLAFRIRHRTENTYDGGLLELSRDGTVWTDAGPLMVQGGYLSSLGPDMPVELVGHDAWGGDSDGWRNVVVDLSSLSGSALRIRWRFATDASRGDAGLWIDDAVIESADATCRTPICFADCNGDGRVDGRDLAQAVECLLATGPACPCVDVDANEVADGQDISALVASLLAGTTCAR